MITCTAQVEEWNGCSFISMYEMVEKRTSVMCVWGHDLHAILNQVKNITVVEHSFGV